MEQLITAWMQRKFLWALSSDILHEYEEILTRRSGRQRWLQLSRVLDLAEARGAMLVKAQPSYQFHVIAADPDDNKFTDCAITADADYIITEDKHFDALAGAGYRPQPITPREFIRQHLGC